RRRNGDDAERKENVEDADAEKRNVTEPDHAPSQRRVAAHPIVAMEEQADDRPGRRAADHAHPPDDEAEAGGVGHPNCTVSIDTEPPSIPSTGNATRSSPCRAPMT